jgi:hypothetical protein
MPMKNFNDTTGNRTRDLPACSAVPQPTALPRALITIITKELRPRSKVYLDKLAVA